MTGRARRATRPTSCHFGAALVRSPRELRADIERWGALALHRCGQRCSGMPRSRPGVPTGPTYPNKGKQFTTDSNADARDPPTCATQVRQFSTDRRRNHRSIVGDRAQRICRFDKTAILFGDFSVSDFCGFAKSADQRLSPPDMPHRLRHHMPYVVAACGGTISIPDIFQNHPRSRPVVFPVRLNVAFQPYVRLGRSLPLAL